MTALTEQRRFFAEEIEALCGLRSAALVEAFATTPRELSSAGSVNLAVDGDDARDGRNWQGSSSSTFDLCPLTFDPLALREKTR